jgi:ABC-type glycerol-3-phosphate transport system substrate-binding protein
LTGIEVDSEQIPEQQQRQKAVIELASGKPSFDVIHLSYHVQKRQFEKAGWLADITDYMKDPTLTAPDLVESDFSAAGLAYAGNKGRLLSLPWSVDYFILYYNKEMFADKGVAVPKTLDEMVDAAEKLTDRKNGIFGFVGRGLRNANMTLWTNFYLNYSMLNDPEIQAGVRLPKEWLQSAIDSAKISKLGLPVVIPVAEFRDIVGAALTATLTLVMLIVLGGIAAIPTDHTKARRSTAPVTGKCSATSRCR